MTPSRRRRNTKLVKGEWVSDSYWVGQPIEETRQEYANARIREFQRHFGGDLDFTQLLLAFRSYGEMYDQGWRLRDILKGAA